MVQKLDSFSAPPTPVAVKPKVVAKPVTPTTTAVTRAVSTAIKPKVEVKDETAKKAAAAVPVGPVPGQSLAGHLAEDPKKGAVTPVPPPAPTPAVATVVKAVKAKAPEAVKPPPARTTPFPGTFVLPGQKAARVFRTASRRRRGGRDVVPEGLRAAFLGSGTAAPSAFRKRRDEDTTSGIGKAFARRRR